jgi:hypothetical protein
MDQKGLVMDENSILWMKIPFYGSKRHFMDEYITFMAENVKYFEVWIKRELYG